MRSANRKQRLRVGLAAVAGVALVAGPAFAFGAMGFGGGSHGGLHGVSRGGAGGVPPRPAIDTPASRSPFIGPRIPIGFHDHDHFVHDRFHDHFHNHFHNGLPWLWGGWGWGGGYGVYQVAQAEPVYAAPEPAARPPEPPCPVLLTWSPKLGRATSQRLCESD